MNLLYVTDVFDHLHFDLIINFSNSSHISKIYVVYFRNKNRHENFEDFFNKFSNKVEVNNFNKLGNNKLESLFINFDHVLYSKRDLYYLAFKRLNLNKNVFYFSETWDKPRFRIFRNYSPKYIYLKSVYKKLLTYNNFKYLSIGQKSSDYFYRQFALKNNSNIYKWGYFKDVTFNIKDYNKNDQLNIIWIGRLIKWKGLIFLLIALKNIFIINKKFNYKLIIVGNSKKFSKYKSLIENYLPTQNYDLIKFISNSSLNNLLENSDILINTSDDNEGWSYVINEAISKNLIVISTHQTGSASDLSKCYTKYFKYNFGNTDELSYLLNQIYLDFTCNKFNYIDYNFNYTALEASNRFVQKFILNHNINYKTGILSNTIFKDKVFIQQPTIAHYRVDLFKLLDSYFDLTILHGKDSHFTNLNYGYFKLNYFYNFSFRLFNKSIKYHYAQIKAAYSCKISILSWDISYITLWVALFLSKLNGNKIILWGHGYSKSPNKLEFILKIITGKLANALIFYDHITPNKYSKFIDNDKLFVAHNSLNNSYIDLIINSIDDNQILNFKQIQNINNSFTILFVGRLYKENNLEILFKSLSLIDDNKNIKVVIIGNAFDNNYLDELKLLISNYKIIDKIVFKNGTFNEHELAFWFLSANIFCYPNNIGLSAIHSLNYSLPILTSNNYKTHNPEFHSLTNGYNSIFFEDDNFIDLTNKINYLYDNPDIILKLKNNCKIIINKYYNLGNMTNTFINAINYVKN